MTPEEEAAIERKLARQEARGCTEKKLYRSLDTAERFATAMRSLKGVALNVYACRFCEGYHLTTREVVTPLR